MRSQGLIFSRLFRFGGRTELRDVGRLQDLGLSSFRPEVQLQCPRLLAQSYQRRHHGPSEGFGEPVIRIPSQEVQKLQRMAETLGGLH